MKQMIDHPPVLEADNETNRGYILFEHLDGLTLIVGEVLPGLSFGHGGECNQHCGADLQGTDMNQSMSLHAGSSAA